MEFQCYVVLIATAQLAGISCLCHGLWRYQRAFIFLLETFYSETINLCVIINIACNNN
jgi:hypothetical protein